MKYKGEQTIQVGKTDTGLASTFEEQVIKYIKKNCQIF